MGLTFRQIYGIKHLFLSLLHNQRPCNDGCAVNDGYAVNATDATSKEAAPLDHTHTSDVPDLSSAQFFWQDVWDKVLGPYTVAVPPVPLLTTTQITPLKTYGFMPMYVPAITVHQYPACFAKPDWGGKFFPAERIERRPLREGWIAIETIDTVPKPYWDDPSRYPNDRLMEALKRRHRYHTKNEDFAGGLLENIAEIMGFPKGWMRLPSVEERNLVRNVFDWLRDHRSMSTLPNLDPNRSWEWVENTYGPGGIRLAGVDGMWVPGHMLVGGFRILIELRSSILLH